MCHSETGMSLPDDPEVDHLYFLARTFDRDHYFYYEPDRATTLDRAFLASITEQVSMYTIWADICEVPNTTLDKWNITFRKIPRDIRKI